MLTNKSTDQNQQINHKYVIAIDLGSSGAKVGLVNLDGEVVTSASGRYESTFLPDGGVEQDPRDWWRAIDQGVRQVIHDSGARPEEIVAIGVTSQWSVTVAVDEQGEPLMNAISWMDSRGGKYNAQVVKGFPSIFGYDVRKLIKWIDIVGYPPSFEGTDDLAHYLLIKNDFPEVYRKTYKFLEPMDFINMRLTGRACATACSNIACILVDNRSTGSKDYHPWTLKLSGIDRSKLPDLLPVEGIVGSLRSELACEWNLSPSTVVITSATDNSVAPIGCGAIGNHEAVAVLGTSGMLVFQFPHKQSDLLLSLVSMPSALEGRYVFSADTGNTGRVIDAFLRNLVYGQDSFSTSQMPDNIYARLNQAAAQVQPGSEGVLFMPWFNSGELAPTGDRFLRGGFVNLTNRTTREHLARAMLEGIAYNWRWLRESAEKFSKTRFPYWRLTGGGAASDTWAQIMADVIGIPMHQQTNPGNNTLLGIAFLAFNRLGMMALDEIPKKVSTKRIFEPNAANQEIYHTMYAQFRRCCKQLTPIFHTLNKTA